MPKGSPDLCKSSAVVTFFLTETLLLMRKFVYLKTDDIGNPKEVILLIYTKNVFMTANK